MSHALFLAVLWDGNRGAVLCLWRIMRSPCCDAVMNGVISKSTQSNKAPGMTGELTIWPEKSFHFALDPEITPSA